MPKDTQSTALDHMCLTKGNSTRHIQNHNKTHTGVRSSTWSQLASTTNINKQHRLLHLELNWVQTRNLHFLEQHIAHSTNSEQ